MTGGWESSDGILHLVESSDGYGNLLAACVDSPRPATLGSVLLPKRREESSRHKHFVPNKMETDHLRHRIAVPFAEMATDSVFDHLP